MNSLPTQAGAPPKPSFPFVTTVIIGGAILVAASDLVAPHVALRLGALFAPLVRAHQWWRLLSYAFVHGGAIHLGMNMFVAYQMAIPLERRLGSARFAEISLVTCIGGAAGVLLLAPPEAVTIGASGMILGWAGLIVPLLSRENFAPFSRFLLLNALISFLPGISWQAHLGGFVSGLACGVLLRLQGKRFSSLAPALVGGTTLVALWAAYRPR